MQHNYWIYLFIMFAVTYLVRVLPLVVFKKKITLCQPNQTIIAEFIS